MTDRQFSHYVVSVSGKKGLGPWLVDDGDEGIHIVNDLASAEPFDTRKGARDLLGWARIEFGPEAKTMAAYVRPKVKDVWTYTGPEAKVVTALDVARATVEALEEAERLGLELAFSSEDPAVHRARWTKPGSRDTTMLGVILASHVENGVHRGKLDFIRRVVDGMRKTAVKP